jgi:DNA-directed RNA polymerase specialized sigma24 family protein
MAAASPVSEAELEAVLRTDPEFAVRMIDLEFRERIFQVIKMETWGRLQPAEVKDAYQETMQAFVVKMRQPDFDPSGPLRIIYCIARRKGLDQIRGRTRRRAVTKGADFLEAAAQSLRGSDTGVQWILLSRLQRKEFQEAVFEIVQTLPDRQKLVAGCFLECYEQVYNEGSFRPLADAVSEKTGKPETVATVKSNWHAARKKIAEELNRREFNFIQAE